MAFCRAIALSEAIMGPRARSTQRESPLDVVMRVNPTTPNTVASPTFSVSGEDGGGGGDGQELQDQGCGSQVRHHVRLSSDSPPFGGVNGTGIVPTTSS